MVGSLRGCLLNSVEFSSLGLASNVSIEENLRTMWKERLECFPARLSPGDRSRSACGISLSVTQGWTRLDRLRDFQPDGSR